MNERLDKIDVDQLKGQLAYQLNIVSDLILTDQIKIIKKVLVGYKIPALIILIPIFKGEDKSNIAVSIVKSVSDSVSYNYELVDESIVSKL